MSGAIVVVDRSFDILRGGAPNMSVGGIDGPVQFHDIAAGTYAVCVGVFDVRTFDAVDAPFGCTPLTIRADDRVREVEVTLK